MAYFKEDKFESINKGYNTIFKPNKLSIGLVLPLENYLYSPIANMENHIKKAKLVEELGFKALWLRDIPFNVPSFADVGQIFDPFVYLGFLSAITSTITLGVASIILPLRHPAHIAKQSSSVDVLSKGRLILGVASGDRAQEYPALNISYENRGERFRDSFEYIQKVWEEKPIFNNNFGNIYGDIDMLPKPISKKVPLLITGASQQNSDWLAKNGNGWITYPRDVFAQAKTISLFRENTKKLGQINKPVTQSLYIDLDDSFNLSPKPIHLGYRLNTEHLIKHLKSLESIGVNHVVLNLRFNNMDIEKTLEILAKKVLPKFE